MAPRVCSCAISCYPPGRVASRGCTLATQPWTERSRFESGWLYSLLNSFFYPEPTGAEASFRQEAIFVDSVLHCRICGSCGSAAFGLERQHSQFRSVSREPGVNDRALSLSSFVNQLAISINAHGVQCVWLCGSCRNVALKQLGDFESYNPPSCILGPGGAALRGRAFIPCSWPPGLRAQWDIFSDFLFQNLFFLHCCGRASAAYGACLG